eukprot:scaffold54513_cov31-Tisochrysis_lutea.AAC.2
MLVQRRNEVGESRPFTSAVGTCARWASRSIAGHSSLSTRMRALGFHLLMTRRCTEGASTARVSNFTRGPRRSSDNRRSAVSVLAVKRTCADGEL